MDTFLEAGKCLAFAPFIIFIVVVGVVALIVDLADRYGFFGRKS